MISAQKLACCLIMWYIVQMSGIVVEFLNNCAFFHILKLDAVIMTVIPTRKCLPPNMKHPVTQWHIKSGSIQPPKKGVPNNAIFYIQRLISPPPPTTTITNLWHVLIEYILMNTHCYESYCKKCHPLFHLMDVDLIS